jgi:hypothetical protein
MDSLKTLYRRSAIAAGCLFLASLGSPAWPQAPNPAPQLVITILDGEGALNDIRQRTAREPIVQVEDENHRPIAGAAVLFTLPDSGPSGTFAGGAQTFSTVTDSTGRAVARGLQPNNVSGNYSIQVKVNYNGSTAETTIHQQNVANESSVSQHAAHAATLKTVLIVVGAAVVGGTIAALLAQNGGGSSTTITPGPPTVGAPTATAGIRISLGRHSR